MPPFHFDKIRLIADFHYFFIAFVEESIFSFRMWVIIDDEVISSFFDYFSDYFRMLRGQIFLMLILIDVFQHFRWCRFSIASMLITRFSLINIFAMCFLRWVVGFLFDAAVAMMPSFISIDDFSFLVGFLMMPASIFDDFFSRFSIFRIIVSIFDYRRPFRSVFFIVADFDVIRQDVVKWFSLLCRIFRVDFFSALDL